MERELIASGIGGQGVQVATRILAEAAAAQGMKVMMFGSFAGAVRGGRSETALVVSDEEIEAPPILPETWSAIGMHDRYFAPVLERLRPGGVAVVNADLFDEVPPGAIAVPMSTVAEDLGNPLFVAMVALGAYVAVTDLVPMAAVLEAMRARIPPYRAQLIPANEEAIARGAAAVGERVG